MKRPHWCEGTRLAPFRAAGWLLQACLQGNRTVPATVPLRCPAGFLQALFLSSRSPLDSRLSCNRRFQVHGLSLSNQASVLAVASTDLQPHRTAHAEATTELVQTRLRTPDGRPWHFPQGVALAGAGIVPAPD